MAPYQQQPDPKFLLDALYCPEEERWEDDMAELSTADATLPALLEQDMLWEEEELTSLVTKEQRNPLSAWLEGDAEKQWARREAVEWVLRVNAHYSFSALTAVLAVNYLDRFLSAFWSENGQCKPWMTQLVAVACLSLAAKVEEIHVPLLLDLQVEETRYVFEAKTIKRMEILVLSTLGWKMNPATPLSFIDYIARRFGFKDHLSRCEALILSVLADSRFLSYLPSVLATATIVNSVEPRLGDEYQNQLLGILGVNKEKVEECRKLMAEVWSSGCGEQGQWCSNKRKLGWVVPGSPNGVIDVSFSSDSSNDSWAVAAAASVSSSPEPLSKKSRRNSSYSSSS